MNATPESVARMRRAFATLTQASPPCPDADEIFAAIRGELDVEVNRRLIDHTASCGACAEVWRLATAFASDENRAVDAMVLPPGPRMFVGYRPLVLAAAAAVLLVASMSVIQYVRPWGAPAPEYREAPGNVIVALPDSAQLPRDACRLRWSAAPAGARYTVRVAAEDLTTVARATDLETPEYVVPVSALSQIPTGGRIVWQVDATLPDGRVIASPTFVTTLK